MLWMELTIPAQTNRALQPPVGKKKGRTTIDTPHLSLTSNPEDLNMMSDILTAFVCFYAWCPISPALDFLQLIDHGTATTKWHALLVAEESFLM